VLDQVDPAAEHGEGQQLQIDEEAQRGRRAQRDVRLHQEQDHQALAHPDTVR
jgi:hypothetical protein